MAVVTLIPIIENNLAVLCVCHCTHTPSMIGSQNVFHFHNPHARSAHTEVVAYTSMKCKRKITDTSLSLFSETLHNHSIHSPINSQLENW